MAGQVGFAALSWGATVVLARADHGGRLVGHFAIASAVTVPIMVLFNLQLRTVVVSDARNEHEFADYLGLRVITVCLALASMLAVGALGSFDSEARYALFCLCGVRVLDGLGDIVHAYMQRFEKLNLMAVSLLVRGIFTVAGIGIGMAVFKSLWAAVCCMFGLLLFEIAVFQRWAIKRTRNEIAQDNPAWVRLPPRFRAQNLRSIFILAMPLGISAVIGAFAAQVPLYIIDHKYGSEALGKFAVIYNPLMAMPIFIVAAFEGVLAQLSAAAATKNLILWRHLLGRLIGFASFSAIALILGVRVFGDLFLQMVYGPSYASQARVFLVLSIGVGTGFVTTVLAASVLANRRFTTILVVSLFQLPVAVALFYGFIDRFGLVGAGYALIAGQAMSLVVFGMLARMK
jgi:O-antigen/teichoic acid export membrane protein